jgi:hypothetical protein
MKEKYNFSSFVSLKINQWNIHDCDLQCELLLFFFPFTVQPQTLCVSQLVQCKLQDVSTLQQHTIFDVVESNKQQRSCLTQIERTFFLHFINE